MLPQEHGNICHVCVSGTLHRVVVLHLRPCADVYNKIDAISLEQMDKLAREDHTVVISCELGLKCVLLRPSWATAGYSRGTAIRSLDYLIEKIWEELDLVKVYTKKRGVHPDLDDPVCMRKGATVEVSTARRSAPGYRNGRSDTMRRRASATAFIGRWRRTSDTL